MSSKPLDPSKLNKGTPPEGGARRPGSPRRFSQAQRLQAVRLYLEEGFPPALICQEVGVGISRLYGWIRLYRQQGEAGLADAPATPRAKRLPGAITDQILQLKREHLSFGIKRISQLLRRMFFLPASPETVRQRLHEAGLIPPQPPRKKKNLTRPRFFERATPNQMWQSDIFTFRLDGRTAALALEGRPIRKCSRFMCGRCCVRRSVRETSW